MTVRIFTISHDRQGLAEVERVSGHLPGLTARLRAQAGVVGCIVLGTCNRVMAILDTDDAVATTSTILATLNDCTDGAAAWDVFLGNSAVAHLFRVAAGLESMVVGEREIAGQLRRALAAAQEAGYASLPLTIATGEALKTSRRVAHETTLESAGRSVVAAGLDLIDADWPRQAVLVVGTGAYAGAVVAGLRHRGVTRIAVHSESGRAAAFAEAHGTDHAPGLAEGLAGADLVVTCSGQGSHLVPVTDVTAPVTFLDLSLRRDVDPAVAGLPGVTLVDLAAIQEAVGGVIAEDTMRARSIVNEGISEALTRLRARAVGPAVVGLREKVLSLVDEEVARLPQRTLTPDDAAAALRRLATRLLHVPSTRARLAAEQDRTEAYLEAMAELFGIGQGADLPLPEPVAAGRAG